MSTISLIILLQHPYEAFILSKSLLIRNTSSEGQVKDRKTDLSQQQLGIKQFTYNNNNNIVVKSAFILTTSSDSSISLKREKLLRHAAKRGKIADWETSHICSAYYVTDVPIYKLSFHLEDHFLYNGPCYIDSDSVHGLNSEGTNTSEPFVKSCKREEFYDLLSNYDNSVDCSRGSPQIKVWIAVPDESSAVLDYLLPWGYICHREQLRQYYWRVRMAKAMTFGGGWASIHNPLEALRYAILLNECAEHLNDLGTVRKCKVFRGWAYLWLGNRVASTKIFKKEMAVSNIAGDIVNKNRCGAALEHTMWNSTLPSHISSHLELPAIEANWSEAFTMQL